MKRVHFGPTSTRRPLWALAIVALLASAGPAAAVPFSIITSGTVTAGTDPGNLLGAGTTLAGDAYTLRVDYTGLGPAYFTDGTGAFAQDFGDTIPGVITVTIAGHSTTTSLLAITAPSLLEDQSDLAASNSGTSATGIFAAASQSVTSSGNVIPVADLQTAFAYTLLAGDTGLDTFTLSNALNTSTASFTGAPTRIQFAVPEPATWSLLAAGLFGLLAPRRRR